MPFQIIQDNIINIKADAIVNSTNTEVIIGEGLDKAIHDAAGPKLFIERKKIGEINTGEAYISSAFHLNAKYVIHTVGPKWAEGRHNEKKHLNNCYLNALQLALDNQCESIAFPLISSGADGYPKGEALYIALSAFKDFLEVHDMMIYLVIYSRDSYELTEDLSYAVHKAIDMKFMMLNEPIMKYDRNISLDTMVDIRHIRDSSATHKIKDRTLDDLIYKIDDTFSETLLKLIDQKGL